MPYPYTVTWERQCRAISEDDWITCFGTSDARTSYRVQCWVEDSALPGMDYHYLIVRGPQERLVGIIPCFLFRSSLTVVAPVFLQRLAKKIRKAYPGFLYVNMFVAGSPLATCRDLLGFHLDETVNDIQTVIDFVSGEIKSRASHVGGSLIIIKEIEAQKISCFQKAWGGHFHIAESVATTFLPMAFVGKNSYSSALRHHYRKLMKQRKSRLAACGGRWESPEMTPKLAARLYDMYLQVKRRSRVQFEELSLSFFENIGKLPGSLAKLSVCFVGQTPVSFILYLHDKQRLFPMYLGMDYHIRDDYSLYYNAFYRVIEEGEDHGVDIVQLGQTSYEAKSSLGASLSPLYLGVSHTNKFINWVLSFMINTLFPPSVPPR
ncbi:GNAT family N-acetyltransferase, partial [Sansalvadorimonas verongulae]|uniref:GNAT family N-acetyltransferase n=1 Tax=Sansalvadorimonas verongulae TaxID=2172824 RepID=UPI0012BBB3FF